MPLLIRHWQGERMIGKVVKGNGRLINEFVAKFWFLGQLFTEGGGVR